jgi:hypothetical protein
MIRLDSLLLLMSGLLGTCLTAVNAITITNLCEPNPCKNGGFCCDKIWNGNQASIYQCICPLGWTGPVCDITDQTFHSLPKPVVKRVIVSNRNIINDPDPCRVVRNGYKCRPSDPFCEIQFEYCDCTFSSKKMVWLICFAFFILLRWKDECLTLLLSIFSEREYPRQNQNIYWTPNHHPHSPTRITCSSYAPEKAISDSSSSSDDWTSLGEAKCAEVLKQLFPRHTFKKVRPHWLLNIYPGGPDPPQRMELDLYCEELKLAVEYDGRQHAMYAPDFHGPLPDGPKRFWGQQQRDRRKERLCITNGVDLIRISHDVSIEHIYQTISNHPFVKKHRLSLN